MTAWTRHEPAITQCGGEDSRRVTWSRAAVWSRPLDRRHDLVAGYWTPGIGDLHAVVYFSAYGAKDGGRYQRSNAPMYVEIEYGFLIVRDPTDLHDPLEQWYGHHNAGTIHDRLTNEHLDQVLAADIDDSMDSHGDGDGVMDDEVWNLWMVAEGAEWALLGANP